MITRAKRLVADFGLWMAAAIAAIPFLHAIIHSLMAVFGFTCP